MNAGGVRVLRYGVMRDLVLGLEAVLADGTVISSLNRMLKNNAGYDLKQLFIGSEGTLGVITRLVLRVYPAQKYANTALLAVDEFEQVVELLRLLQADLGGALASYEVMWPDYYRLTTTPPAPSKPPSAGRTTPTTCWSSRWAVRPSAAARPLSRRSTTPATPA